MFGISNSELLSCFLTVIGIFLLAYALLKKTKRELLIQGGEQAEGVIFETAYRSHFRFVDIRRSSSYVKDRITVRFVTKDLEWITGEIDDPFAIYYTGQYKPGDKVKLVYNPKNPNEFSVITGQSETLVRLIAALAGLLFFLGGLYSLFFSPLM